jgi:hypothetical protein
MAEYLTLDDLLARGWTPRLIRRSLGDPDRDGAWLRSRVELAERRGPVRKALEEERKRRAAQPRLW